MPPKKTSKKSAKKISWTPRRVLLITLLALITLILFLPWYSNEASIRGAQKSLESYLEDKYDRQFTVERPHVTGAGIGMPGSWRANAYLDDDISLQFEVGKAQDEEKYFDYYTGTVWVREEKPRVEALLTTLYGKSVPDFDLRTHITTSAEPDPIRGDVPDIYTAIKQYSDTFFYSLSLKLSIDKLDEKNKEEIRTNFTKLSEYVNSKKAKLSYLSIRISVIDENAGYACGTSDAKQLGSLDKMFDHCLSVPSKKGVY